jgi:hypothetical protein
MMRVWSLRLSCLIRLASSVQTFCFLFGLSDYAARNQVPVELQDLPSPHFDIDPPSPAQAAFQRLRSLICLLASNKILAVIEESVIERIYGRSFAFRTLPAYQRSLAEPSQPWLPSSHWHPVASLDFPATPLPAAPSDSYSSFLLEPPSSPSSLPSPIHAQLPEILHPVSLPPPQALPVLPPSYLHPLPVPSSSSNSPPPPPLPNVCCH